MRYIISVLALYYMRGIAVSEYESQIYIYSINICYDIVLIKTD